MDKPGKIIGDTACPKCRSMGRDNTGNHLIIFDNGNRYCNRCGYKDHGDNKDNKKIISHNIKDNMEDIQHVYFKDVSTLPIQSLPDRKINKNTCQKYGVHVGIDESNGGIESHYYPVHKNGRISGYKKRDLPKAFSCVGDCKGTVQLFGQQLFSGGKKLLITGGELDALAAYQMMKEKYSDFEPSVVSLPKGETVSSISDNMDWINGFDQVIIYTDMDDVGRKCAAEIAELIGPKAAIMSTSLKDASDMLVAGLQKEFINSFFSAKPHVPDGFVTVDDVFEKATAMPTWGRSYPWPTLTKLTYGRRNGEGIYIGAGVKCGKSSLIDQLTHHIIAVELGKVALFKMEEDPAMTARKVAGLFMRKPFHKPDGNFTQKELIEGVNNVRDKILMFDSYGSTSWDRLKGAIRHAVIVEKCQDIIIDPLTRLTVGLDSAEANVELERIADELSSMAKDLGFFYVVCCHLRAPTTGKPHEMGGMVQSNQFAGSRAMMRACYYMLGIQRNKDPALDEDERNTSQFVLLEDRAFGNIGKFNVFYNKSTGEYLEPTSNL